MKSEHKPLTLKELLPARVILKKKLDGCVEYVRFFDPYKRMSGAEVVGYERLICMGKSKEIEHRLTFTLDIDKSRDLYRSLIKDGYKPFVSK